MDDTAEATAYYVVAEAVTNAQRYSHASAIAVSAVVSPHLLDVEVADDGVGGASEVMSSGLQGLRDRVEAIGGTFELESPPGEGTRVSGGHPGDGDRSVDQRLDGDQRAADGRHRQRLDHAGERPRSPASRPAA